MLRLLSILLLFIFCSQSLSKNYLGRWKLLGGSVVEIYEDNGMYEGKIIKRSNFPIYNRNGLDNKNPNKELRKQPIVGLIILKNLCFKDGVLSGGTLYNADKGETYQVKLEIFPDNINECSIEVFTREKTKKFKINRVVN